MSAEQKMEMYLRLLRNMNAFILYSCLYSSLGRNVCTNIRRYKHHVLYSWINSSTVHVKLSTLSFLPLMYFRSFSSKNKFYFSRKLFTIVFASKCTQLHSLHPSSLSIVPLYHENFGQYQTFIISTIIFPSYPARGGFLNLRISI